MHKHLLVPMDLTDRTAPVAGRVLGLVDPDGGRITLLHIVQTFREVPFEEEHEFYAQLEETARGILAGRAEAVTEQGIEAGVEILFGESPAREIVRYAESRSADLIVMASHPLDPGHPAESFGKVSHQVALLARCPVLLLR